MIKKLLVGLIFLSFSVNGQINNRSLENFNNASYQSIEERKDNDVTIIFDRTYIDVIKGKTIEFYKTVHRKIKINSLYGLERYNKLYIPTFNDLSFKLEFVDCKVKTLKKNKSIVTTSNETMVNTTLPANTPFYYKVNGKVKMLAIKDINIGDEIEYVYTTKQVYDVESDYFYKAGKLDYGNSNFCLEKTVFIDAKKFKIKIWPYNFNNGINRKSDFSDESGYKISLKNITANTNEIYSRSNLEEPYLFYEIKSTVNRESDDTWEDFAKHFKPRRHDTKKNYILNGLSIEKALSELDTINGIREKYKDLLNKINQPIEDNFYIYEDVKDDITVALGYAKVISKTAKKLELPINFHFLVSKNHGNLDKSFVSLYQFDAIICSFINDKGITEYFPLIEPYSSLNDVKKEYQQTECFTIKQDINGGRVHNFEVIPLLKEGDFQKKVHLTLNEIKADTLKITVQESLKYTGHSWIEIKPVLSYFVSDSLKTKKRLKSFIKSQLVINNKIDSIYNIRHSKKEDSFTIDYQYDLSKQISSNSSYFNISPIDFFKKDFFTPYYQKNKRVYKGYFTNEFNTSYFFSFKGNNSWKENRLLKSSINNEFGTVSSTYNYSSNKLETSVKLKLGKTEFEASNWSKVLELRETMYDFLNSKLYFKL